MESRPRVTYLLPKSEADWETIRPIFTRLYMDENRTLPQVMRIMKDEHRVSASEKRYKNKIKVWNLRKYLTGDEPERILNGEVSETTGIHTVDDPEQLRSRAQRSLLRKRARERAQIQTENLASPITSDITDLTLSPLVSTPSSPDEPSSAVTIRTPSWPTVTVPAPEGVRLTGVTEQFLRNLRRWTHDAYVFGHWDDTQLTTRHQSGRQASRALSTSLKAGITLFENGKESLAWILWNRAFASFQSSNLFKTWYHEIPMSLLFEVGRVAHSGHPQLASMLLESIQRWAHLHFFLDEQDSRRALFGVFGNLQVAQLRDLYDRAARCLYDGLKSRVDKQNKLLYEVRLNRALDMLWYDSDTDLTKWLPPIQEVDQACGPNNPYSVYFLLLEAYRLVAQDLYDDAEQVCSQVRHRLAAIKESQGIIDPWRVGLAYRRLGRQQHDKGRFEDARRSFNTALKYVSHDDQLSTSVLIEICQRQQNMAHDQEDVFFWGQMLSRLEQKTTSTSDTESKVQEIAGDDGDDDDDKDDEKQAAVNKRRRLSPSSGTRRANTF